MNRYRNPYPNINAGAFSDQQTPDEKKHMDEANMWRFVGDIAPAAGAVLGGIGGGVLGGLGGPAGIVGGIGAGAAAGGGIGSAIAQGTNAEANNLTAHDEATQQNRADRRAMLMQALMSMRR